MVSLSKESNAITGPSPKQESLNIFTSPEGDAGDREPSLTAIRRRGIAPLNYLRVAKEDIGIEGQYALDLSLLPLPRRAFSDKDPNLSLYTNNGSITAEIWIIHDESGNSNRASLNLCTNSGSVHAKVHDPSYPDGHRRARPSLNMQIHADHGDIFISLPRCFRGSITIATDHGPITFSPSLAACTATFLDTIDERAYFVGDRPRKGKSRSGNKGDKAQSTEKLWDILEVRGVRSKVRINWVDEQEQPKIRPGGGKALWNSLRRLFKSG